jgi:hypothetical protein
VFREDWDAKWRERWITFGTPAPVVVPGPGGTSGFWSQGDYTHISTAVLRMPFIASDGLGVELLMHTTVTDLSHQRARVQFAAGIDTLLLLRADQLGPPPRLGDTNAACSAAFPGSMADGLKHTLDVLAGDTNAESLPIAMGAELAASGWWRLRMQVLPDGRCGVAVNGKVVWLSSDAIALDRPLWLRLGDRSAGTRLLHGPMEVWTGVRADIAWTGPR